MTWTGDEIKRRRLQAGLNQRQLGDAVGVSNAAISRWEGTTQPNISVASLGRLNHILGDPPTVAPPQTQTEPRVFATRVAWTPDEIRRRRLAKGLRQSDLAEQLGTSKRLVTGWENNASPPSARHLLRLQEVLWLPEDEPDHDAGPLLRDASFTETLLRMVELHNADRRRQGLPPLLHVGEQHPPHDLPEHDTVEGADSHTDTRSAERARNSPTDQ